MKLRKLTSVLCITALLVSLFSSVAFAANGDLVYEMTPDEVAGIAAGDSTDFLQNAGGPTKSVDGTSLKLFSRSNDYDSIDIKKDLFAAGVEYTIIVELHADSDTEFKLGQAAGPYNELAKSDKAKTATLTYKYKDVGTGVRIQTNGSTGTYWIDSIKVYEGEPAAAAPAPAAAAATDTAAAPAAAPAASNPKTGDNFAIYLAVGVLAIGACGAVVLSRKSKNA